MFALVLVGIGLDVTGAFLGSALSLIAIALILLVPLRRQLHGVNPDFAEDLRLRQLISEAWVPVMGLTLLLALQELHIIIVKHEASEDAASLTPSPRWRCQRSCGSRSGSGCTCCRRLHGGRSR